MLFQRRRSKRWGQPSGRRQAMFPSGKVLNSSSTDWHEPLFEIRDTFWCWFPEEAAFVSTTSAAPLHRWPHHTNSSCCWWSTFLAEKIVDAKNLLSGVFSELAVWADFQVRCASFSRWVATHIHTNFQCESHTYIRTHGSLIQFVRRIRKGFVCR